MKIEKFLLKRKGFGLDKVRTHPGQCSPDRAKYSKSSLSSLGFTDYSQVDMLGLRCNSVNFGEERNSEPRFTTLMNQNKWVSLKIKIISVEEQK